MRPDDLVPRERPGPIPRDLGVLHDPHPRAPRAWLGLLALLRDPASVNDLSGDDLRGLVAQIPVLQGQLAVLEAAAVGRVLAVSAPRPAERGDPEPSLLDVKQAAQRLHVSENFLRGEIEKGRLGTIKVGRNLRIEPAALGAYIAERRRVGWRTENP